MSLTLKGSLPTVKGHNNKVDTLGVTSMRFLITKGQAA